MDCQSVDQAALDPGRVAGVVGDQRRRADRGPFVEPAVDDFDGGEDTLHRGGDFLARARLGRRGQIAGHLEGEFGLDDAHEEFGGVDARWTLKEERREQPAGERRIDIQLTLRGDVGAGDLVSDHAAAVVGEQLVDQAVLDGVGFAGSLGADRDGKFGQALVIDSGLGQEFRGIGHLNMVTTANSCDPGCDTAPLRPGAWR